MRNVPVTVLHQAQSGMQQRATTPRWWGSTSALLVLVFGVVVCAFAVVLVFANSPYDSTESTPVLRSIESVAMLAGVVFAFLVLRAQPNNAVGWWILAAAGCFLLAGLMAEFAIYAERVLAASLVAEFAGWIPGWVWIGSQVSLPFILLYYPTGRLHSSRWRPVAVYFWLATLLAIVLYAFGEGFPHPQWVQSLALGDLSHPFIVDTLVAESGTAMSLVPQILLISLNVIAVAGLVVKYRRGSHIERTQIRVVAVLAIMALIGLIALQPFDVHPAVASLLNIGIVVIFAGVMGAAIVRYRLFDIDRLVSRTVSYSILVGFLAAAFYTLVAISTMVLPGQDSLVVAATTLVVFALFNPLRGRIQHWVDKRFNRRHYDTRVVLEEFSDRLKGQTRVDIVQRELVETVADALEPQAVSIWVRGPSG